MLILSLQHSPKAKDTRSHNYMLLNFEAEAKSLRPKPIALEAKARGYEAESRPRPKFWTRSQFGLRL